MSQQKDNRPAPAQAGPPRRGMMGGMGGGPMGFGRSGEKAKDVKGTLRRLLMHLRRHWVLFLIVALTAAAGSIFGIRAPRALGNVTTELFRGIMARHINYDEIGRLLIILGTFYLCQSLLQFLTQFIMTWLAQHTVRDMRALVSQKLTRMPLRYFDSHTHGEIMSRVTNDIDQVAQGLQQSISQAISSVVTVVGIVYMMLDISSLMTLIAVVTLPLSAIVVARIAKLAQRNFSAQQKSIGELNGHVEEMYGSHKVVLAYGMEERNLEKFRQINGRLYGAAWRAQFVSGIIMPMMTFVGNIGYVLACVMGGVLSVQGKLNIGDIQSFLQYIRQFNQPIQQIAQLSATIQSAIASAERVFAVLDEAEETPDPQDAAAPERVRGEVSFSRVQFGYSDDKPLMNDLSLDVAAGQTIAIVGPTGAGKTTLVNLLMRFYDVQGGQITVDGVNIRDMKRAGLRRLFGMVLQDTWLFSGTVRENIAYARDDATQQEVETAAKAAYVDHVIRTLPDGYDTVLGEEAGTLSQGERQLVTIARAVLANPQILILDEATSSVDTRTERNIQRAMAELMKGRTSFVIAHRLSTITGADKILVMQHGDVVEQGTHEQLLGAGGAYAELYNSQFAANQALATAGAIPAQA